MGGRDSAAPECCASVGAHRLSRAQERELVMAAGEGCPDSCRVLTETFLPEIVGLAHRFPSSSSVNRQELIQEGVAGLLLAARRYDSRLSTPFWAYASFWVRKAMQELVAELTRPVALSDRAIRGLAHVRRARRELVRAHGSEPTLEELMIATGLTRIQLESLQATERRPRSIEGWWGEPADSMVRDAIVDTGAEWAFDHVLDRIEMNEVNRAAARLDERERAVVRAHFGLGEPAQTLNQIGCAMGVTAERARQIETGALCKLRAALTGVGRGRTTPPAS